MLLVLWYTSLACLLVYAVCANKEYFAIKIYDCESRALFTHNNRHEHFICQLGGKFELLGYWDTEL